MKKYLKKGTNKLRFEFSPAVKEQTKRAEAYPYVVPAMQVLVALLAVQPCYYVL